MVLPDRFRYRPYIQRSIGEYVFELLKHENYGMQMKEFMCNSVRPTFENKRASRAMLLIAELSAGVGPAWCILRQNFDLTLFLPSWSLST